MDPALDTVIALFHDVHQRIREAVQDLDPATLNWVPAPGCNAIAALVVHTLGSEAEVLRTVANVTGERDRDAEFRAEAASAADLIARIDAADTNLAAMTARITPDDLAAVRPRGDNPPETGRHWLMSNYGHAREHLGHIDLTKQIYAATGRH